MLACVTLRASVELGLPSGALARLWSALVLRTLLALRSGAERAELSWRTPSVGVQQELEALKSPSPGSRHKDDCIQFCSVAQLCGILCDPMNCSTPGFPVLYHLSQSLLKFTSNESVMLI